MRSPLTIFVALQLAIGVAACKPPSSGAAEGPAQDAGALGRSLPAAASEPAARCEATIDRRIVRGKSLEPLIPEGQAVTIHVGLHLCRPVRVGEVVAYRFAGNTEPIVKLVRAVPGDSLAVVKRPHPAEGWHVVVNGQVVKNSAGLPHVLDAKAHQMVELYVRDYRGKVPERAYLLMGDRPEGTTDGTRFGLVDASDLVGIVQVDPPGSP